MLFSAFSDCVLASSEASLGFSRAHQGNLSLAVVALRNRVAWQVITRWALTGEQFVAALAKTLGLVDVIL